MNNLAHHDTSKRHIRRELNLARALDEDTRVFSLFSTGPDSCFWEFLPSSVALGIFVFFLIFDAREIFKTILTEVERQSGEGIDTGNKCSIS